MVSGGVGYAMLSAFVLSLGMNVQRYALHPEFEPVNVKCCGSTCCKLSKDFIYGIGLGIYMFANMIYTMGLSYAPLSLMSAIFASVLVFNWLWAGIVFQNRLERSQLGGNVIILTGVVLCACFASDKEETYGVKEIQV
jgi:drug/metabolite transporter (DMT)-like permease